MQFFAPFWALFLGFVLGVSLEWQICIDCGRIDNDHDGSPGCEWFCESAKKTGTFVAPVSMESTSKKRCQSVANKATLAENVF